MNLKEKLMQKSSLPYLLDLIFVVISLFLLFKRIAIAADRYDEIINLNVSYAAAVGRIPFWEGREAFQSGDLFLTPFLYIFLRLRNSTNGIVLFSRMIYFMMMLCIGILIYFTFKQNLGRRFAFYLGFLCLFFQVHCLYYPWYDTVCIATLTVTLLLIYNAVTLQKKLFCFVGGIFAGMTSFFYPTILVTAILVGFLLLLFGTKSIRSRMNYFLCYGIGGSIVALSFIVFVLANIGLQRFIDIIEKMLESRSINEGSLTSPFSLFADICTSFLNVNCFLILPTFFLVWLFFKAISSENMKVVFLWGIILFSALNSIFFVNLVKENYAMLNNFLGYIALWAPLLGYLTPKDQIKNTKILLLFVWLPSIFSSIPVALGTKYADLGPVKNWEVFLPAAICSLIFMLAIMCNTNYKFDRISARLLLPIVCGVLLYNYTAHIYGVRERPLPGVEQQQEGIWAGIKLADTPDINNNLWLEKLVRDQLSSWEDCETIAVSSQLRTIYLMTSKKPLAPSVETLRWEKVLPFYEEIGNIPDILVLLDSDYNEDSAMFIDTNYTLQGTYKEWFGKNVLIYINKSKDMLEEKND